MTKTEVRFTRAIPDDRERKKQPSQVDGEGQEKKPPLWSRWTLREALAATKEQVAEQTVDFCENYRDWDEDTHHPNENFLVALKKLIEGEFLRVRGGQAGSVRSLTLELVEKALLLRANTDKEWKQIAIEIGYADKDNDNYETRVEYLQKQCSKYYETVIMKRTAEALEALNEQEEDNAPKKLEALVKRNKERATKALEALNKKQGGVG